MNVSSGLNMFPPVSDSWPRVISLSCPPLTRPSFLSSPLLSPAPSSPTQALIILECRRTLQHPTAHTPVVDVSWLYIPRNDVQNHPEKMLQKAMEGCFNRELHTSRGKKHSDVMMRDPEQLLELRALLARSTCSLSRTYVLLSIWFRWGGRGWQGSSGMRWRGRVVVTGGWLGIGGKR